MKIKLEKWSEQSKFIETLITYVTKSRKVLSDKKIIKDFALLNYSQKESNGHSLKKYIQERNRLFVQFQFSNIKRNRKKQKKTERMVNFKFGIKQKDRILRMQDSW